MKKRDDGKLSGKNEEKILENEMKKPTYYLIGWNPSRQVWTAVVRGLVSFSRGSSIIEQGRRGMSKIMMVSQVEFRALGMPHDEAASEYFTIEGQLKVSNYYGQNKASRARRKKEKAS